MEKKKNQRGLNNWCECKAWRGICVCVSESLKSLSLGDYNSYYLSVTCHKAECYPIHIINHPSSSVFYQLLLFLSLFSLAPHLFSPINYPSLFSLLQATLKAEIVELKSQIKKDQVHYIYIYIYIHVYHTIVKSIIM